MFVRIHFKIYVWKNKKYKLSKISFTGFSVHGLIKSTHNLYTKSKKQKLEEIFFNKTLLSWEKNISKINFMKLFISPHILKI